MQKQKVKGTNVLGTIISKVSQDVFNALKAADGPEVWSRFMDIRTTALYLDKSETCIRNWIREGVIPTVQLSTLKRDKRHPVFVDRYALDQLIIVKN